MNAVIEHAVPPAAVLSVPDSVTKLESGLLAQARASAPSPLSRLLETYWRALPAITSEERLQLVQRLGDAARHAPQDRRCVAVPLLGDPDDAVVFAATLAYASRGPLPLERRRLVLEQVLDWIRRGLALRRSAVFAALLSLRDAQIDDLLRPLRLRLSIEEFHAVGTTLRTQSEGAGQEFLAEWAAMLAPVST
jgi:hypothetical protein